MKPQQNDPNYEQEPEVSKSGAFRFDCPVCRSARQLEFTPDIGYLILCGNCLVVLVTERAGQNAGSVREFRPLQDADLPRMIREQYEALLEAKHKRLRARLLAKWAVESEQHQ